MSFGLKGRFCQPRPKAWETEGADIVSALKGPFTRSQEQKVNDPFRVESPPCLQAQAAGLG
jgi:hypothetical protein